MPNLLSIDELTRINVEQILSLAKRYAATPSPDLSSFAVPKIIAYAFFEPSTRTRLSFEMAAKRLGFSTLVFEPENSSLVKGESHIDTLNNIAAMGVDAIIIRHSDDHFCQLAQANLKYPRAIINAGTGLFDHPSQALLDLFTIIQQKPKIEDLIITIVGDIKHSRVAHSNIALFSLMGCQQIRLVAPPDFKPNMSPQTNINFYSNLEDALVDSDVVMMLRIQKERLINTQFPLVENYHNEFGLTSARLAKAKHDVMVMHPGPINRGIEITSEVADGPNSFILKQVENSIPIRMAILSWCLNHQHGIFR